MKVHGCVRDLPVKRLVWTLSAMGLAACGPPPPTKEELLAKWGATYSACLQKYAGPDGATPAESVEACRAQFVRTEEVFTGLQTELRIKAPDGENEGGMTLTAVNPEDSGRIYRAFTIRVIYYPNTVKFVGEAGARKTHEEFWTVEVDIAPGETLTFLKKPERPIDYARELYYHFALDAKYVPTK